MQVTLEINSDNLDGTLIKMFDSLSEEKRVEIAEKVLTAWLNEPLQVERNLITKQFAEKVRTENRDHYVDGRYVKGRDMTDEDITKACQSDFVTFQKSYKTSKHRMIENVIESAVNTYKDQTVKLVNSNELLKDAFNKTAEEMKTEFPKFVHDAMMFWFTNQFSQVMTTAQNALYKANTVDYIVGNIRQKLGD